MLKVHNRLASNAVQNQCPVRISRHIAVFSVHAIVRRFEQARSGQCDCSLAAHQQQLLCKFTSVFYLGEQRDFVWTLSALVSVHFRAFRFVGLINFQRQCANDSQWQSKAR